MSRVAVAFLWHHHQPYYKDLASGRFAMPWVRLHATRDYPGMALLVREYPRLRATFNLVPSLLDQLEDYAAGRGMDRSLEIAQKPPSALTPSDREYLLDHFFAVSMVSGIDPFPRYRELHRKREAGGLPASAVISRFSPRDLLDLQVWHNLAWFHPLLVEKDSDLAALRKKGQDFDAEDKRLVLDRQREAAASVVLLYRELERAGQVEISTTPHFHPILPLLIDPASCREAIPGCPLPREADDLRADARAQVRRAIESHRSRFGRSPAGMWPAEGSVSEEAARLLASEGLEWIASDEGVLARSLGVSIGRDGSGHCTAPAVLYRGYRVADGAMSMIFRDHKLSDLIGFDYQRRDARDAVEDFLGRIRFIRDRSGLESALVPVILDGENCWEHYRSQGVEFLRRLYDALSREPDVETVRIGEELRAHPPEDSVPRLFAGSWIGSNFSIWIGHEEDRQAWEALYRTRRIVLDALERSGWPADETRRLRAIEELLVAEGSDWFWWFGDEHHSGFEAEWDVLFRTHLANACAFAGLSRPEFLHAPIKRAGAAVFVAPRALLRPVVDGFTTSYFEWLGAGLYDAERDAGAMSRAEEPLLSRIHFGFGVDALYLRLDSSRGPSALLSPSRTLEFEIGAGAARLSVQIALDAAGRPSAEPAGVSTAAGTTVEIEIPLRLLPPPSPGQELSLRFLVREGLQVLERAPLRSDLFLAGMDVLAPVFDPWP